MVPEYNIEGKVALITGAGRGIGTGIAEVLAEAGADIALNALSSQYVVKVGEKLATRTGRRIMPFVADVTRSDQVADLVRAVLSAFGRIDILVNNLGDAIAQSLVPLPDQEGSPVSDEDIRKVIDVNLTSAILCTRAIGSHFLDRRSGKVIIISSSSGVHGRPNLTLYGAGKGGLLGFTHSLALEWAPYGIQVNGICPGTFPDRVTAGEARYQKMVADARTSVPVGREGRLREVGLLALYLGSSASDYMTGQMLFLDGGLST